MVPGHQKTEGERVMMRAVLACLILVAGVSAAAADRFRTSATPGVRAYRYTSVERTQGRPDARYRVDFDLATGADGSVVAIVRKAERGENGVWSAPAVDDRCRAALGARDGELARVTLSPLNAESAKLGEAFMAMCAPAAYFFPMTDILNVSLVQTEPRFQLASLRGAGASARFAGFQTSLDRLGVAISASSPGGVTKVLAVNPVVVVDWMPDPMNLTLVNRPSNGPPVTLKGIENFAFRLEIDRLSGALKRAWTTHDALDLVVDVPGVPADKLPRVAITREVVIETR
jgi:hypothetical protein